MPKFLRIFLAVLLGFVIGSIVNMGLITIGGKVIPPPVGADMSSMQGLKNAMQLFEAKHFLFPFLAHALGTLVGALVASLATKHQPALAASIVAALFLMGGIASVFLLAGPAWFNAVDLLFAYLPSAWLGHTLATRLLSVRSNPI